MTVCHIIDCTPPVAVVDVPDVVIGWRLGVALRFGFGHGYCMLCGGEGCQGETMRGLGSG